MAVACFSQTLSDWALPAGAYNVKLFDTGGATGIGLLEIYELA